MRLFILWLAALAVCLHMAATCEAHIMTADFVRSANRDAIANHQQEKTLEGEKSSLAEKKQLAEKERLENKALKNMSKEKQNEVKMKKKEDEARAEMKTLKELKRMEKKFKLKTDNGMSTELKSFDKEKYRKMKRSLGVHKKGKQLSKEKLEKATEKLTKNKQKMLQYNKQKMLEASKEKTFKTNEPIKNFKPEFSKNSKMYLSKKSQDETILKHAPAYMKEGRTLEERRALKKLRRRIKREALEAAGRGASAVATKSILRPRQHRASTGRAHRLTKQAQSGNGERFISNNGNKLNSFNRDQSSFQENHIYSDEEFPVEVIQDDVIHETNHENEFISAPLSELSVPSEAESGIFPLPDIDGNEIQSIPEISENEVDPLAYPSENDIPSLPDISENEIQLLPDITENEILPIYDVIDNEILPNPVVDENEILPIYDVIDNEILPNPAVDENEILPFTNIAEHEIVPHPEISTEPAIPLGNSIQSTSTDNPQTNEKVTTDSLELYTRETDAPVDPFVPYIHPSAPSSDSPPSVEIYTLPPEEFTTDTEEFTTDTEGTTNTRSIPTTTLPETPEPTTTRGPWPWANTDPDSERCGQAKFGPENRGLRSRRALKILEGKEALPGSFPWQVAILDKDRDLLCGGTLVAHRWVVTAAHCVRKKLYVRLFEHHIHNKDGLEVEQKVRRIYRHPAFNRSTIDNDIALLRLPALPAFPDPETGVPSRGVTDSACLPSDSEDFPPVGTRCLVMGWGKASASHGFGTDILMYTRLPIISRKACVRANRKTITENMFCAGHYKGGSDTCSGDSGGPLLCSIGHAPGEESWTMYGVTSFGDGCGNAGKMGVYSKVNNYLTWMADIMGRYL